MRIQTSQFRCPKCKTPINNPYVKYCPNCKIRLTTKYISKHIKKTLIAYLILFPIVIYFTYQISVYSGIDTTIFIIGTIIILVYIFSIIGIIYVRDKRKLERDKDYIGSSMMVELEEAPGYENFEVKYWIIPIIFIACIIIISFSSFILFVNNLISLNDLLHLLIITSILIAGFVISALYGILKVNKDENEIV